MASILLLFLQFVVSIWNGRCVLTPPKKDSPTKFQPHIPPPEDRHYYECPCSSSVLAALRSESKTKLGVIISGQGGSATRAAQEIVELVGTHDFGHLDPGTKDSWAVRLPFQRLFKRSLLDARAEIIKSTGKVEYNVTDIDIPLHKKMSEGVCKTLTILNDMRAKEPSQLPWALKEPFLRFMLPFFAESIGDKGFLFVHVTRDIRNIHKVHGDEELYSDMNDMDDLTNTFVNTATHPEAVMLLKSPSPSAMLFDSTSLIRAMNNSIALYEQYGAAMGYSMENIKQYLKFAFVWGHIELSLHHAWMNRRPDRYFHLSELKMASDGPTTARRLAAFLGSTTLAASRLAAMQAIYRPKEARDIHWILMQGIVKLDGMQVTREALEAFGYAL